MSEPQHASLIERTGAWDCAMKMWMGPGEPLTASGTSTETAVGAFHVLAEFHATVMGMPYHGHGISSYDPVAKKYVNVWVDSTEATPTILEGTHDEATKEITYLGEGMIMGQRMKMRQVVSSTDEDHRVFDMFITPPGGEEMQSMRLEYTRRK